MSAGSNRISIIIFKRIRIRNFHSYSLLVILTFITILWFVSENKNRLRLAINRPSIQIPRIIPSINDETMVNQTAKQFPNIPIEYWMNVKNIFYMMFYKNVSCAPFPHIHQLNTQDLNWQTVELSNKTSLHLHSAFYDTRKISSSDNFVRILTMINRTKENFKRHGKIYCQLWYDNKMQPILSPIVEINYGWRDFWKSHKDGAEATYLFGCVAPNNSGLIPKVVSVVENPCDKANNLIKITYNKQPTKSHNVTVCVKGLEFLQIDISLRLIEWIEYILLMGVDKIYFYQLGVHPNTKKVLNYYIKSGNIDVREANLPPGQPNIPYLQNEFLKQNFQKSLDEILLYNDCFYRLMYKYKYITLLDIDEIILPLMDNNWNDLLNRIEQSIEPGKRYATLNVRNTYFLNAMTPEGTYSNIPPYLHMLQHAHRSYNHTPPLLYVKSYFNTDEVYLCHNHLPFEHSKRADFTRNIPVEYAQLNHYREKLNADLADKSYEREIIKDTRLWDFKDILITRVNNVLNELKLYD